MPTPTPRQPQPAPLPPGSPRHARAGSEPTASAPDNSSQSVRQQRLQGAFLTIIGIAGLFGGVLFSIEAPRFTPVPVVFLSFWLVMVIVGKILFAGLGKLREAGVGAPAPSQVRAAAAVAGIVVAVGMMGFAATTAGTGVASAAPCPGGGPATCGPTGPDLTFAPPTGQATAPGQQPGQQGGQDQQGIATSPSQGGDNGPGIQAQTPQFGTPGQQAPNIPGNEQPGQGGQQPAQGQQTGQQGPVQTTAPGGPQQTGQQQPGQQTQSGQPSSPTVTVTKTESQCAVPGAGNGAGTPGSPGGGDSSNNGGTGPDNGDSENQDGAPSWAYLVAEAAGVGAGRRRGSGSGTFDNGKNSEWEDADKYSEQKFLGVVIRGAVPVIGRVGSALGRGAKAVGRGLGIGGGKDSPPQSDTGSKEVDNSVTAAPLPPSREMDQFKPPAPVPTQPSYTPPVTTYTPPATTRPPVTPKPTAPAVPGQTPVPGRIDPRTGFPPVEPAPQPSVDNFPGGNNPSGSGSPATGQATGGDASQVQPISPSTGKALDLSTVRPEDFSVDSMLTPLQQRVLTGPLSFLRPLIAGINFNNMMASRYPFNEIALDSKGPRGGRLRVDSYVPNAAIISRKLSQLAGVAPQTAIAYLRELAGKYAAGQTIGNTARNQALGLAGDELIGELILQVPPQSSPVPPEVLAEAARLGVYIVEVTGKVLTTGLPPLSNVAKGAL
ncbi:hypothetical protein ACFWXB_13915 [Tsukamurella tyrosinosolvens]|uniref:hypothetical protein n=1 Tax=Tsukamurella tyrosinosolvens TaxID=57704 RepID=UPI002DD42275|nr:hypothetical protein [Tsukamurella tyrosinosolvens]MEC4612873.1 hypothetical protein [Tsukamurella tyrosinosolvens]